MVELPDRKEISLCEAVTAVIYGKARDVTQHKCVVQEALSKQKALAEEKITSDDQTPAKEVKAQDGSFAAKVYEAAYAGRIKFRAIKEGKDPADGFEDIDRLYFYVKPFFHWAEDVIFHREDKSSTVWYFVHLDREQFASLLRDMDVAAQQNLDPGVQNGTPGSNRPTALLRRPLQFMQYVLWMAQSRLDAEEHPKTITAFSKDLAE